MQRKIIEFLSTVSGKITIIVVIGILAVAGIQTVRNQAAESQAETDIADDSDDSDESVQKEVPEAVKLTGKEYIGNELYYYREKPKVPVGCIEAVFMIWTKTGRTRLCPLKIKTRILILSRPFTYIKKKGINGKKQHRQKLTCRK